MNIHIKNMDRETYLKVAEVVDGWYGNAGRFLVAHPTWTFNEFANAVDDLRLAFSVAFGFGGYLAGQKPEGHDDARDVDMTQRAFSLYLAATRDQVDIGG